jgi:hypothetical protein
VDHDPVTGLENDVGVFCKGLINIGLINYVRFRASGRPGQDDCPTGEKQSQVEGETGTPKLRAAHHRLLSRGGAPGRTGT